MECSYDRAVAFALLRLTASHQRITFSESTYNGEKLNLIQILSPIERLIKDENPHGLNHLESLEKIKRLLNRKKYAEEIFKKIDEEKTGLIDVNNIKEAMSIFGFDFSIKICNGFMSLFDIDQTGHINLNEFKMLLHNRSVEVDIRIRNLSGQLIMALKPHKSDPSEVPFPESGISNPKSCISSDLISDNSGLRDESGRRISCGTLDLYIPRYVPPSEGLLFLKVADFQTIKPLYKVNKTFGHTNYIDVITSLSYDRRLYTLLIFLVFLSFSVPSFQYICKYAD